MIKAYILIKTGVCIDCFIWVNTVILFYGKEMRSGSAPDQHDAASAVSSWYSKTFTSCAPIIGERR